MDPNKIYVADFECRTWVDYLRDGEVSCYLWHMRNITQTVEHVGFDIESFIECIRTNKIHECWFFNVKYDGGFILDHVLKEMTTTFRKKQERGEMSYWHIITPQGQWMELDIAWGDQVCKFKDAAKKYPAMTLQEVAEMFGIPGKSDDDFNKPRPIGYVADEIDIERVKGDTRILAYAMYKMIVEWGMGKLTMASEALTDFKWSLLNYPDKTRENWKKCEKRFKHFFPALSEALDAWFRSGYDGGWTFVNPEYRGFLLKDVDVLDENSMYPDKMMNCRMPIGMPMMRKPRNDELYVIKGKFRFKIRKGKFPCVQYHNSWDHSDTEFIYEMDEPMELTMAQPMWEIFNECYDVWDTEDVEYMSFNWMDGSEIFGNYINKWMGEKERWTGVDDAMRTRAKLFLNSLYGKFAEDPMKGEVFTTIEKECVKTYEITTEVVEHGVKRKMAVKSLTDEENRKYLPVGMFITAYARKQIVHTANIVGKDFVYADTDSVHCFNVEKYKSMLDIDDKRLGAWKHETHNELACYVRAKAYYHAHAVDGMKVVNILRYYPKLDENGVVIKNEKGKAVPDLERPKEWDLKCGGASWDCKANMIAAIESTRVGEKDRFMIGGDFDGKLARKTVKGGPVLKPTEYKFHL